MTNEFVEVVTCPNCNQEMAYDCQASDGDGDIYDLYVCRLCGHQEQRNVRWVDHAGGMHWCEDDAWLADMPVTGEVHSAEVGCANDPELDDIPW